MTINFLHSTLYIWLFFFLPYSKFGSKIETNRRLVKPLEQVAFSNTRNSFEEVMGRGGNPYNNND